jgi:hemoglobin-like flavoprotein
MTQQTIDAIRAAANLVEEAGPPAERNQVFYNYLREHTPELAKLIRQL